VQPAEPVPVRAGHAVPGEAGQFVALVAGVSCIAVLTVFFLAGNYVFNFFGITVPAFHTCNTGMP